MTKANTMRGPDIQQDTLFSTVSPETRVPKDHPLRPIRNMVDQALKDLDDEFAALYSAYGRESIPPEKLLRAQLLMAFYTIRSERQLMEQINLVRVLTNWSRNLIHSKSCWAAALPWWTGWSSWGSTRPSRANIWASRRSHLRSLL